MRITLSRGVTLLLLVAVCLPGVATRAEGEFKETLRFENKNDTKKIELHVPASARLMSVQVKSSLRAGAINWTLRDASGNERLRGEGRGKGRYIGSTGNIDAIPGVWTLEVGFEDATGSYDIVWMTG
ncbi:MAG TPA: hypothetical protein VGX92_18080 [Pyrinomonadaceae bacterium]|jgi:hypothetical protein|nr:hypothetical protein [Pyrinomonadaceae bacterium]